MHRDPVAAAARPQENYYGMVLRSRFELSEIRFRTLVQEVVPSLSVGRRFGSDHLSVICDLYLTSDRDPGHNPALRQVSSARESCDRAT
jgi:hypothetical protein